MVNFSVRQSSLGSSDLLKTLSLWSWKRVRKNIIHRRERERERKKNLYCSDSDLRGSSQFDKAPVLAPTFFFTLFLIHLVFDCYLLLLNAEKLFYNLFVPCCILLYFHGLLYHLQGLQTGVREGTLLSKEKMLIIIIKKKHNKMNTQCWNSRNVFHLNSHWLWIYHAKIFFF